MKIIITENQLKNIISMSEQIIGPYNLNKGTMGAGRPPQVQDGLDSGVELGPVIPQFKKENMSAKEIVIDLINTMSKLPSTQSDYKKIENISVELTNAINKNSPNDIISSLYKIKNQTQFSALVKNYYYDGKNFKTIILEKLTPFYLQLFISGMIENFKPYIETTKLISKNTYNL
jgi:hypothetical protein